MSIQFVNTQDAPSRWRTWFSGGIIRCDNISKFSAKPEWGERRHIRCIGCEGRPESYLEYLTADPKSVLPVAVSARPPRESGPTILDPRRLGFVFQTPNLIDSHLEVFFGTEGRSGFTVSDVLWNGKAALSVTCERRGTKRTARYSYTVVPELSWNVVSLQYEDESSRDSEHYEATPTFQKGVWFPTKSRFVQTIGGRETRRDEVEVTVHSLNEPLDASVFRIEGMDLPAGTPVMGVTDETSIWDGKKLVPYQAKTQPKPEPHPASRAAAGGDRWGLWAGLAALGAGLAVAVLLVLRRRGREAR